MNYMIRILAVAVLMSVPAFPALAIAAEGVPTEQEIRQAEGEPPVIPHRVKETDIAGDCLKCHEKGKKGAPVTSHPERKSCTQCHVQGEVRAAKRAKKRK